MKLSDLLMLHYTHQTAKKVSEIERRTRNNNSRKNASKPVPFETTVHVQIPLDEVDKNGKYNLNINVPPGVTVSKVDVKARIIDNDELDDEDEDYAPYPPGRKRGR